MANEIPIQPMSRLAAANLSAKQFYGIKVDSAGKFALAGAGENAVGILQNKPISGAIGNAMILGESKAILGGTVTAGSNLMTDANAKFVTHTGTNSVVCVAMEGGDANEIITVLLVTRTGAGLSQASTVLSIPIDFTQIADGDLVTDYIPGFAGTVEKISMIVTDPVTTAAKLSTLNVDIEATPLTGGSLALTSANMTPLGAVVDASAITAANAFTAAEKLSVIAASTTTFIEGTGLLVIVLKNA